MRGAAEVSALLAFLFCCFLSLISFFSDASRAQPVPAFILLMMPFSSNCLAALS